MNENETSQKQYVYNYFVGHPNKEITTDELVSAVVPLYKTETGKEMKDPDRAIRTLYSEGKLIKIKTGIYKYDPNYINVKLPLIFPQRVIESAKIRDENKCVVCGRGQKEGMRIMVDHIKPRQNGGLPLLENAQTLCGECHNLKHTYGQTEFAKKMFVRLRDKALADNDDEMLSFIDEILSVYEKHSMK